MFVRAPRLKAYLALIVIAAAAIGLGHVGSLDFLAEWVPFWRSARVWTDPALDRLAAPEPKELKRLSARISPFVTVFTAAHVAAAEGYFCDLSQGSAAVPLRVTTGERTVVCAEDMEGLRPGRRVLLLRARFPLGFVRGVELKRVTPEVTQNPQLLLTLPSIAVGKGVVFPDVGVFADFIVDRFFLNYHGLCFEEQVVDAAAQLLCSHQLSERARHGLPRWNGQPISAGRHEQVQLTLRQAGFECAPPGLDPPDTAGASDTYAVRCALRTFAEQALDVTLLIDARDSRPRALRVAIGGEHRVIPLSGRPVFEHPDTASFMVQFDSGEVRDAALSSSLRSQDTSHVLIPGYARLDEHSRRRIVNVLLAQMNDVVEPSKEHVSPPLLQRLDIAAYLLARFGTDAVSRAQHLALGRSGVPGEGANAGDPSAGGAPKLSLSAIAAIALAGCRVAGEGQDCLRPAIAARPEVRGIFISALDELRMQVNDFPESHPTRERHALLDRQIAAFEHKGDLSAYPHTPTYPRSVQ